jgi:serine/threonine protein phosphatase PrpC
VRIIATARSDVGQKRPANEDCLLSEPELGLFVVCDGMGGHAAGEVASQTATATIRQHVEQRLESVAKAEPDRIRTALAELMREAVEAANVAVHRVGRTDPSKLGAGTTCTALLVHAGIAALGHVGDSRLYLQRGGMFYQISNDHTFVAEGMRRGLSLEEALAHFGRNMLSRAVGPTERVEVDTLVFDLLAGDKLLLCSDGLHGYFPDTQELGALIEPFATCAERLVDVANERGGEDNISVIVLSAADDGPPTAQDSMRKSRVTQNLRTLGGIEILRELTYSELLELSSALTSEEHASGAVMLREGDRTAALYILVEGKAQVERGGKRMADLVAGSHFGEMALLTSRPRSATVRAVAPCRVLVLTREQLYPLFQSNPVIAVKFLWNLAVRQSLRLDEVTAWLSTGAESAPDTVVDDAAADLCASPYSLKGG